MLSIDELDAETLRIPIVGTSPLITHNWSEKAKRMMLDKQQGRKNPKENRDPQAEYEASKYRIYKEPKGKGSKPIEACGMPVVAFKSATTSAARFYDKSVSMVALRQFLFFKGIVTKADPQELFEIDGEPEMREDMVTVGINGTDLRYRAMFPEWRTTLQVTYIRSCISQKSVLSLVDAGGFGVGVGEWRPECNGQMGTYTIDRSREIEVL
jgi:hypothetical protein